MYVITAFERRATLTLSELSRLEAALADDVERYREAIRGYPATKMQQYGQPHLSKLQGRLEEVRRLIVERGQAEE